MPEPVLKSKQPLPFEIAQPDKAKADEDLGAEDLVPDEDEEPSADDEVDLATGEDDLGVAGATGRRRKLRSRRAKFPFARAAISPKGRVEQARRSIALKGAYGTGP